MTNKSKNILLVLGFAVAIVICYQLAISNTIQLKREFTNLKSQELLFKNTPSQISLLKQKQAYYDSILSQYHLTGSSIQNNLLKTLNTYADQNNLKVINFLEPHVSSQNNLISKTYEFTVEGHYNDILQLIYKIEQQTKYGEIISLLFEKKKNYRTGRYFLQARVLLKSFG